MERVFYIRTNKYFIPFSGYFMVKPQFFLDKNL